MNPNRFLADFYQTDAVLLAPLLLGQLLCRNHEGHITKLPITETEAYCGVEDTACHAHKGKTSRNQTLYLPGGHAYIYLCYGRHHLLNIVSGPADQPQAVLIRGLAGIKGPGRLTKALAIDKNLNGEDLCRSCRLWLEPGESNPAYQTTPRIGIDYATDEYKNKLWRFVVEPAITRH